MNSSRRNSKERKGNLNLRNYVEIVKNTAGPQSSSAQGFQSTGGNSIRKGKDALGGFGATEGPGNFNTVAFSNDGMMTATITELYHKEG